MVFDCRLLGKRTSKDSVERHTNNNWQPSPALQINNNKQQLTMGITPTDITPQDISPKDILEEFTIKPVTIILPKE